METSSSSRNREFWRQCNSVCTLLLCLLCFIVVLATAVLSRLTMLLMVHNLRPPFQTQTNWTIDNTTNVDEGTKGEDSLAWITALLSVICIPHIFYAVSSLASFCFQKKTSRTPKNTRPEKPTPPLSNTSHASPPEPNPSPPGERTESRTEQETTRPEEPTTPSLSNTSHALPSEPSPTPSGERTESRTEQEPNEIRPRESRCKQFGILLFHAVVEGVHATLLVILVFVVLPSFDPILGLILSLNVTLLPTLLQVLEDSTDLSNRQEVRRRIKKTLTDVILFGLQITALVFLGKITFKYENGSVLLGLVLATVLLVPVGWCGNFAKDVHILKKVHDQVSMARRRWGRLFISVCKIAFPILAVVCFYTFHAFGLRVESGGFHLHSSGGCNAYLPYILALGINFPSSLVCYVFGKVACEIRAQVPCFAIPLMIAPLVAFGLMFTPAFEATTVSMLGCEAVGLPLDTGLSWETVLSGTCSFLAYGLAGRHVFREQKMKVQVRSRLFGISWYSGIFVDTSLIFIRMRKRVITNDSDQAKNDSENPTPVVYLCATMWHEERKEMLEVVKSIKRLYDDQAKRGPKTVDYYKVEAHIFFDDAFEPSGGQGDSPSVNVFVETLIDVVAEQMKDDSCQHSQYITPYGGRLVWKFETTVSKSETTVSQSETTVNQSKIKVTNELTVHLKDKTKVRNKKRWSQVMYMNYFLEYRLPHQKNGWNGDPSAMYTFLLALDGDVDFQPEALLLLIDRLKLNANVGAACGRIHPVGSGPIVWWQKFEYAAGHWLVKVAEHVFGCVLCSPGCFSLFRGSALKDHNVMETYAKRSTEARDYVQYDQGEDRWLCTLLLKQGYRVEYCAASDSYTHAPEEFYELFNQRRRWTPSTIANIWDLLCSQEDVRKENNNISFPYIVYQFAFFFTTMLTPGTVFLLMVGGLATAFPEYFSLTGSMMLNIVPVVLFGTICFQCRQQTQLFYALVLSIAYIMLMSLGLIGLVRRSIEFGICSVISIFLCLVVGVFLLSAVLHPKEFTNVLHGFLYYLCVPSMSMLLIIYSLANMHVVSWGTREVAGSTEERQERQRETLLQRCFSIFIPRRWRGKDTGQSENADDAENGDIVSHNDEGSSVSTPSRNARKSLEQLGFGVPKTLDKKEKEFWENLIERALLPHQSDTQERRAVETKLRALRNKVCLGFFVLNGLFVCILFTLTVMAEHSNYVVINFPCNTGSLRGEDIEIISVTFLAVFGFIFVLQFLAMIWHRLETMRHIAADTTPFKDTRKNYRRKLESACTGCSHCCCQAGQPPQQQEDKGETDNTDVETLEDSDEPCDSRAPLIT